MNSLKSEVYDIGGKLICGVEAELKKVEGDQVEIGDLDGDNNYLYYGNRPNSTFVLYLLNRKILEELSNLENRNDNGEGIHIHDCINTEGAVICWPHVIKTEKDAKEVLRIWSIFLAMFIQNESINSMNKYVEHKGEIYKTGEDISLLVDNIINDEGIKYKLICK